MGKSNSSEHPIPGMPVEIPSAQEIPGILPTVNQLYALDYIKRNHLRRTLLLMPVGIEIDRVVELAQAFCKERRVNFSWIEKAIVDLTENESENNGSNTFNNSSNFSS